MESTTANHPIDETIAGVLNDGTRVLFRPIRPDDKDNLRRGIEAMSPESRYRRFFAPIDHLSDEQLAYLTEIDYQDHFAWIAFLPDVEGFPGVGVARWVRDPAHRASAEPPSGWLTRGRGRAWALAPPVCSRDPPSNAASCNSPSRC